MFSNIQVPTDSSKLSEKAVQQAMLQAKLSGAKLIASWQYADDLLTIC